MIKELLGCKHSLERARERLIAHQEKVKFLENQYDQYCTALIAKTEGEAIYDHEDYRIFVRVGNVKVYRVSTLET